MPKLILTRGIPGSGKSTWATQYQKERLNCVRINRDSLRWMTYGAPYTKQSGLEKLVRDMESDCVRRAIDREYDVVLDNTHCNMQSILDWWFYVGIENIRRRHSDQIKLLVVDFPITIKEAIERDAKREFPVGQTVIRQMAGLLRSAQKEQKDQTENGLTISQLVVKSVHGGKIPFTWEV